MRMEPPLDQLAAFETLGGKKDERVRFAVRSVLESEWKREAVRLDNEARRRRGGHLDDEIVEEEKAEDPKEKGKEKAVKRDFFGRIIKPQPVVDGSKEHQRGEVKDEKSDEGRIWVSFHEGFSNAVRKPVTLDELMRGL